MIRIETLTKKFADQTVLNQVTYHFPERERIALVGGNGQGKTTLLNIVTGMDAADSGQVIRPKRARIAFLPQSFSDTPKPTILEECMAGHQDIYTQKILMDMALKTMEANYTDMAYETYEKALHSYEAQGGYQLEGLSEKVLQGLGFVKETFQNDPRTLSGGWRMRLELGKILVSDPDFIILDEPTNHLDLPSIEWLESYLLQYKGTLLFVSHDRAFLNELATITLHLNQGQLREYKGNFDAFCKQKALLEAGQGAMLKKLEQQKAHMQKFVDRFRAKASKASQAQSRIKQIGRINETLAGLENQADAGTFQIPKLSYPPSGKEVLLLEDVSVGYDKPLIQKIYLRLNRGHKVGIVGANGQGKTTLLKTVFQQIPPLKGKIEWGAQVKGAFHTQGAAEAIRGEHTVLQALRKETPDLTDQQQRALLGTFMFHGTALSKKTNVLSGGERSRLAFACLFGGLPNFVLMDEPTNHLDMASKDILANMLIQYTGTLLFVSHDRDFLEQVADELYEVQGETLQRL